MTNMLTDAEIAAHCREKAKKLLEIADLLDGGNPTKGNNHVGFTGSSLRSTVDDIVKIMGGAAKRRGDIQKALNIDTKTINELMTPENGFIEGAQGWMTYQGK